MAKNTGAPKCKTCGKTEWRHLCAGRAATKTVRGSQRERQRASSDGPEPVVAGSNPAPETIPPSSSGRTSAFEVEKRGSNPRGGTKKTAPPAAPIAAEPTARMEYLKIKARERRKREREEADKNGITVAAYRARKAK